MFYGFIRGFLIFCTCIFYRVHITGRENIPEGAAVVCSNHTALFDPIFAIRAFPSGDPLRIMLKKELMSIPVFSNILRGLKTIPVNRDLNDIGAVKASMGVLKSGGKLFMYPEGTRVRKGMTVEPKTGAVVMASRCNAPLLPVYTTSGNKWLFSRVDIVIGKPYTVSAGKDSKHPPAGFYTQQSKELMDKIFALRPQGRR